MAPKKMAGASTANLGETLEPQPTMRDRRPSISAVPSVTSEQLDELREALSSQIEQVRKECLAKADDVVKPFPVALQRLEDQLGPKLAALANDITRVADESAGATQSAVEEARVTAAELRQQQKLHGESLEQLAKVDAELQGQLQQIDAALKEAQKALASDIGQGQVRHEELVQSLSRFQADTAANFEEQSRSVAHLKGETDVLVAKLRAEAEEESRKVTRDREALKAQIEADQRRAGDDSERMRLGLVKDLQRLTASTQEEHARIGREAQVQEQRGQAALRSEKQEREECEAQLYADLVESTRSAREDSLTLRRSVAKVVDELEDYTVQELYAVSSMFGPNRSALWNVDLNELRQKGRTVSGTFHSSGCRGLKLELKQSKQEIDDVGTTRAPADCSVYLHAPAGVRLQFMLFVGRERQKELTFEHTFTDTSKRHGSRAMFQLAHFLDAESGLVLGCEILEFEAYLECWQGRTSEGPDPRLTEQSGLRRVHNAHDGLQVEPPALGGEQRPPSLVMKQHRNFKAEDHLKKEITQLKERHTKRVEWRIPHCSQLLRQYPPGRALWSAPFSAAGIDDLQLILYPNGQTTNDQNSDGYCSFLVCAPAGSFLKGFLVINKDSRSLMADYPERGSCGKVSFCRFKNAIREDDTINCALEITEARHTSDFSKGFFQMKAVHDTPKSALEDTLQVGPLQEKQKISPLSRKSPTRLRKEKEKAMAQDPSRSQLPMIPQRGGLNASRSDPSLGGAVDFRATMA